MSPAVATTTWKHVAAESGLRPQEAHRLRTLKPIGVIGLSVALSFSQLAFLRSVWSRSLPAFILGCVSFAGLAFTMVLAWRNELSMPEFQAVAGIRGMVSVHGVLNTIVVAPCFLLAVSLDAPHGSQAAEKAKPA
jgi:hypothetical protein